MKSVPITEGQVCWLMRWDNPFGCQTCGLPLLQEARTWDDVPTKKKAGKTAELDFSAKAPDGTPLQDNQQVVDAGKSLVDVEDEVYSSDEEPEVCLPAGAYQALRRLAF